MAASKDACFIKTFRAKIVPERLRSFVMPADGVVSNWIPADGRVQKDTIIATVNEDEIELERKEAMKKRGLSSPDMADALALAICHGRAATSLLNTERVFDPMKYDTR